MRHEDDRETRVRVAREGARLLHDHRERSGPPPGAAAASWQALGRRIAAGEASPLADEEDASTPARRGAPGWRRWAAVAVALAAAVTLWQLAPRLAGRSDGAAGHAASLQQSDPGDPRSAASRGHGPGDSRDSASGHVLKNMLQRTDDDPGAASPGELRPRAAVPGDSRVERAPVPGDSRVERAPVPGDSREPDGGSGAADLARELALLRAAAEALRAGHGSEALAQAEGYLHAHPAGAFVPEARLHRAEALCLLGRVEDARAASASFLLELPDSPLRARIAAVCAP